MLSQKTTATHSDASNSSTWEAETGGSLSLRPAWSTKGAPGQLELHRVLKPCLKNNKTKKFQKVEVNLS